MTALPRVIYPSNLSPTPIPWFTSLRALGRKIFRIPGLRGLRTLAQGALMVTEPPAYLSGSLLPQNPVDPNHALTVINANLWHDWPHHRRLEERLEAFALMAENITADLVLLQEVARTPHIQADEWLASRLNMAYIYVRVNGSLESIGFEEGLAILSRFPLTCPQVTQLSRAGNPFVRRLALSADVDTPLGALRAVSTHLSLLPKHNARQLDHLRRWVGLTSTGSPALIGGDFNAGENSPQIVAAQHAWLDLFRRLHPLKDGSTHHLSLPWGRGIRRRLDYLFLKPGLQNWDVEYVAHLPELPSDHDAVIARLVPEK